MIGELSLILLFAWLISAVLASEFSRRGGFSERAGLASGLIFPIIAPIVWFVVFLVSPRKRRA